MKSIKALVAVFLILSISMLAGCGSVGTERVRNHIRASFGENELITGGYDTSLSAVCSNGVFVGQEENGVLAFKGIPYAVPPVGDLRWKDPVPAADSENSLFFCACNESRDLTP